MTVSYKELGLKVPDRPMRETAAQWFQGLPVSDQRQFFGAEAWQAFQDGRVTLTDFIGVQKSKTWGDAFVEKSLKAILATAG